MKERIKNIAIFIASGFTCVGVFYALDTLDEVTPDMGVGIGIVGLFGIVMGLYSLAAFCDVLRDFKIIKDKDN